MANYQIEIPKKALKAFKSNTCRDYARKIFEATEKNHACSHEIY